MTSAATQNHSRRKILIGASASGLILAAPPVLAGARPTLATANRGTVSACGNAEIMTSAIEGRLSRVADFAASGSCQMTPDTVEGPYFICDGVESAREITGGRAGEPLTVALRVLDQTCTPIAGAIVDAWACDALGWYSGHNVDPDGENPTPRSERGKTRMPDTPERYLRGVLATDAEGIAEFDMIYPSFYGQRAIHTHYKVHIGNKAFLTAQALYPESFNEKIMAKAPYNTRPSSLRTLNANDAWMIVEPGMFTVVERGERLVALITLTVQI